MIPLCTTATRPASSVCGWALASVAGPCVAQRVWPIPVAPAKRLGRASPRSRTRPACLATRIPPVAEDRDARRVVAAVLEPGQALEDDRGRLLAADVADDSTHDVASYP